MNKLSSLKFGNRKLPCVCRLIPSSSTHVTWRNVLDTTVVSYGVHTHNVLQQKQMTEEIPIFRVACCLRALCGWGITSPEGKSFYFSIAWFVFQVEDVKLDMEMLPVTRVHAAAHNRWILHNNYLHQMPARESSTQFSNFQRLCDRGISVHNLSVLGYLWLGRARL